MSTEPYRGPSSGPEWRRSRNEGPDEDPRGADRSTEHEPADPPALDRDPDPAFPDDEPTTLPRLHPRRRGKRLVKKAERHKPSSLTSEQRVLILDAWQRSGLPAKDFAPLVGVSHHTLYNWRRKFNELGPAGLEEKKRGGPSGSRLPDVTKRAIVLLKQSNPDWGCQRISDVLYRGRGYPASPKAVARVLKESGYELEDVPTTPHRDKPRRFEREKPSQMWQTDLFSFVLKRQNRRVHVVVFLDDHSRFIVSYGVAISATTELVRETLRQAITNYGAPEEVLTDNGPQYVTWRGKSQFTKECEARGIRQIVARPRHPQTLGKTERFWGTLWRELLEAAVFVDVNDAIARVGHFIDHYNFHRPHQGIDGLVPADRFFEAAPEVKATLATRVASNAVELARDGEPKQPFYLTGQVGAQSFSVHAEGERVFLVGEDGEKKEVELTSQSPEKPLDEPQPEAPCPPVDRDDLDEPRPPGVSPLDLYLPDPSSSEAREEDDDAGS